jgi:hypothetical protein
MPHARQQRLPHTPVTVEAECPTPWLWRQFKRLCFEQGWARTGAHGEFQLTAPLDALPVRFHEAVRAYDVRITGAS